MGSEFGQASEWSADAGVDWAALGGERNAGVQRLVADLNAAYRADPALWTQDFTPDGFGWIDANDSAGNVVSFLRQSGDGRVLACVANFSGGPHLEYRVGLPSAGRWTEVINTDAETYGGSGTGNYGGVEAVEEPWHGRPASAVLTVPPLGVLWLALEGVVAEDPALEDAVVEDAAVEDAAAADGADETDEVADVVEFPVHVSPPGPPPSAAPPAPATAPAPPAPSEPLVSSASPAPSEPYVPSEPQAPAAGAGGSGDGDDAGLGEAAVADL
jgi:1,4-alpha-glucan branching enzyme